MTRALTNLTMRPQVVFGLLVLVLGISATGRSADRPPLSSAEIVTSCSARNCHGGLHPVAGSGVDQVEHMLWIMNDPHARAYEVLSSERSLRMGRNLGWKEPPNQHVECLACHTNPNTAAESSQEAVEGRLLGIGCQACHGDASHWVSEHTAVSWRNLPPEQKRARGMTPLGDPSAFAATCLGCHIGAPASPGIPARDVNHDLIAAGHPRLAFEFGAFLENLPRHWSEKREKARGSDFDARAWLFGQVAGTRASLELLKSRAEPGNPRWPEFAEYDCFTCHHDLTGRLSRAGTVKPPRVPGSLVWNRWPYAVAMRLEAPADLKTRLGQLGHLMNKPLPPRLQVIDLATRAAADVEGWMQKARNSKLDPASLHVQMLSLVGAGQMNWDESAQTYYGLAALSPRRDQFLEPRLVEMARLLAFPLDQGSGSTWDSPRGGSNGREKNDGRLKQLRQEIRVELQRKKLGDLRGNGRSQ